MKKIIITSSFIFAFVMYSLYQYFGASGTSTFVAAKTSTPNTSAPITQSQPVIPSKKAVVPANKTTALYADGTFTGNVADAYYGNIQVQTIIQNGKIVDVQFLQYPNDRSRSVSINTRAMPILKSEAISAQSANVDIVSGATDSSQAFIQSLGSALTQSKNS